MKLTSLFGRCLVSTELKSRTAEESISEVVDYLSESRKIRNKDEILNKLLERERMQSTALGGGVAIPHARIDGLREPLAFVGISQPGTEFAAHDGAEPVHLVIFFITPLAESETHLKILSQISSMVQNRSLVNAIINSGTREGLCHVLGLDEMERQGFINLTREEIFRELETTEQGLHGGHLRPGRAAKMGGPAIEQPTESGIITRIGHCRPWEKGINLFIDIKDESCRIFIYQGQQG
ncbi:MAG: PTS sugar transporter subunit IIA [bacterium]